MYNTSKLAHWLYGSFFVSRVRERHVNRTEPKRLTHEVTKSMNTRGSRTGCGKRALIAARPGIRNPSRSIQAISTRY